MSENEFFHEIKRDGITSLHGIHVKMANKAATSQNSIVLISFIQVCMRAGIYHGGQILCQHKNTKEVFVENGLASFDEPLTFDLQVADIPRMARLCFLLYCVVDRKGKGGKNTLGKKAKDGRQVSSLILRNIWKSFMQGYHGSLKPLKVLNLKKQN